ncbi:hypothetical protein E2C01_068534 [Portunus trituberculatus]|uniref:Uncharacterized protein n=1 Tax=Portunus trituberculatus TaxID=210409 RepID=A0A5B7I0C5_PORTR|nr:hypothetical protein [Portunus trituberculatus]
MFAPLEEEKKKKKKKKKEEEEEEVKEEEEEEEDEEEEEQEEEEEEEEKEKEKKAEYEADAEEGKEKQGSPYLRNLLAYWQRPITSCRIREAGLGTRGRGGQVPSSTSPCIALRAITSPKTCGRRHQEAQAQDT